MNKFKATKLVKLIKRSSRKQRLIALGILIAMAIPFVLNTLNFLNDAEANWSPSHANWTKRKRLKLTNNSSDSLAANTTVAVSVDTKELFDLGKLSSDCGDLRVLYQPDSSTFTELARHLELPNNSTCNTSEATMVYFKLQAALSSTATTGDYYMYYANPGATAPTVSNDAFDLASTNAMLVCPFRGTTNCVNASGAASASTDTGSIRFNGLKSALLFDGVNDYGSAADSPSLSVTGDLTVEAWVKTKKTGAEQTIIGKWDETTANDDRSYRLYITSGDKFAFSVSSAGTAASVVTITGSTSQEKGTWYHVAGVYDASAQTLDLYLNGTSDATQVGSAGSSIDNNNSLLYVGAKENTSGSTDTYLGGITEEIRISNTIRYAAAFTPPNNPLALDFFTQALYHADEAGNDPRQSGKISDETAYANHATISGAVFVAGFIGYDGPSEFGSHTGSSNAATLTDSGASWSPNEWVGYILFNSTDASHGVVTANTANTVTATLLGGSESDWDNGDLYTLSPDLGKAHSQAYAEHNSVFIEEATTNKITNPSFENTTYDSGWVEGSGAGTVIAVTRTTADTGGGTQDITNSNLGGNTPKAVIIIATGTTSDGTVTDDVVYSIGAATGTTNEWVQAVKNDHGDNPDDTDTIGQDTSTVRILDASNANLSSLAEAEFSAFITNGVRLNWTTTPSAAYHLTVILFAGSDLQAHANHVDLSNSAGYFDDITEPGFQPDLVFGLNQTEGQVGFLSGYGFAHYNGSTITQRGLLHRFGGTINTVAAARSIDTGICGGIGPTGGLTWYCAISDFDSSGFTVTTVTAGSSFNDFWYLALDFGSISSWVGTHTTPTSTGNYSETGPGFTPQFVMQLESFTEAINTPYGDNRGGSLGFTTFDPNESYSNSWAYEDNVAATNSQTISDNQSVNITDDDGTTASVAGSFVSMDTSSGWTTNYTTVTATGKIFPSMAVQSPAFLTKTIETSEPYVKFGSRSTKIVASGADTSLIHSVDPNSTGTHTLSFYVYRGTAGNIGGTVDNTIARALWEGASQSTTAYENVGGGWWRLTYSAATTDATNEYGVWLADGETLYVDGFVLEEKASATTYTDGSLGTGYTWSGSINASTSSRAAADLDYAASSNIQASAGSVSFWVRPNWAGNDGVEHTFFDVDTSAGSLKLYKTTGNVLTLTDGTNTATADISAWTKGDWHFVVADWGSSNMHVYTDASAGTAAGAFSAPTLGTSFYIGQNKTNANPANAAISDFRVFDAVLTAAEVTDIYNAGSVTVEQMYAIDAYQGSKGQDPVAIWHFDESSGTTASDSTPLLNHLSVSGATWDTQSVGTGSLRARNLKFDGSNDYLTRDPDDDYNFGTESFSISGWFRHPSTVSGTDTILARFGSAGYKVYMNSSGFLCFGIDADSTWTPTDEACSTTSYADSNWHQFVAVKDGTSTMYLYVDSQQVDTEAIDASTTLNSNSPMYLGIDSDGSSNPWDGFLDEIVIYPYARSATQVQADYLGGQVSALYGTSADDFLTEGLVGYWKMDESATPSVDSSGNAKNGTWNGNAAAASGKFGNSATFDGTDDYIDMGDQTIYDFSDGSDFTVSGWFYMNAYTSDQAIVSNKSSQGGNVGWMITFDDPVDRLVFDMGDGTDEHAVYTSAISTNQWLHFTAVFDDDNNDFTTLYINGVNSKASDLGNLSNINNINPSTVTLRVGGQYNGSNDMNGKVDEVRIYNRALSPAEVSQLYNQAPGPILEWKLDEGSGTTANDTSGTDKTGTLANSPTWIAGKYGSALSFAGNNQQVNRSDDDNLDFIADQSFTVETWFKHDTASAQEVMVSKLSSDLNDGGYRIQMESDGDVSCLTDDDDADTTVDDMATTTAATYDDNKWHHVACVYDTANTDLHVYIDGVLTASDTTTTTNSLANTDQLNYGINTNNGTYDWIGQLDHLRIYNYTRTASQIVQDMNAGHPIGGSPISSEVIHWKFDEGDGATANNSNTANPSLSGTTSNTLWKFGSDCKINSCLDFDSTDYVNAGDVSFIDGLTGFTTSFWVYLDSLDATQAFVTKHTTNQFVFEYHIHPSSSSELRAEVFETLTDATPGLYDTSGLGLTTGEWQHIAIVYDGTGATNADKIKVYRNGVRAATGSTSNTIPASLPSGSTSDLRVGTSQAARATVNGKFDAVKMYNTALTDAQVMIDMNSGSAASFSVLANQDNEDFGGANPVGWWKIDEGTGTTTINDFSGSINDLTMNNFESTDWAQYTRFNHQSWALTFDGSTESLSRTDDDDFDFGSGEFSVSAWVRHNGAIATSPDYIITKAQDGTAGGYKLYMDASGDFCFDLDDDTIWNPDISACTSGIDYDDSTWHHVTGVKTGAAEALVYVDGELVARQDNSQISHSNANALYIGMDRDGTTGGWDGQIDEVKIFNYALTSGQVAYQFNRSAPFAWYKFDECTGSTINNSAPVISGGDASYDGTITIGAGGGENTVGDCSTSSTAWGNGATGKFNGSLDLDGTDDYVDLGDQSRFEIKNQLGAFTIEAWVNRDTNNTIDVIAAKTNDISVTTAAGWYLYIHASDTIGFTLGGGSTSHTVATSSPYVINSTGWNHIVATYVSNTSNIYLNGNLAATGTGTLSNSPDNALNIRIGSESDGTCILDGSNCFFDGKIDNVKFYNSFFNADQVKKLYNEGRAVRFGPQTGSP